MGNIPNVILSKNDNPLLDFLADIVADRVVDKLYNKLLEPIMLPQTEHVLDGQARTLYKISMEPCQKPQEDAEVKPDQPEVVPKFYTRKEIATLLGCSLPTVHQLLNTGVLRYTKIGRKTLIFKDYADRQMENGGLTKYRKRAKKDEA